MEEPVLTTLPKTEGLKFYFASLFMVFALVSFFTGTILELSGILNRAELQTIDRRFEARRWIVWSPEGLKRLNLMRLIDYHQQHEIPRRWWAWDYTLSWLLEPNHIPVVHKIVIFNHLLEDEPPLEALESHPWMKPLMQFPVSRATIAGAVEFLARSGARAIILDNDFPQFSPDDMVLAKTINACSSGKLTGRPVPILMASTVNHRSFVNILQLDVSTGPAGILKSLAELEPGVDVQSKYTGTTSMILDEDQVVRRSACRIADRNSVDRSSITVKALLGLNERLPSDLSDEMDIDFAGAPNSDIYPVRPFSYLMDPDLRFKMTHPQAEMKDVSLNGAVVILGDGVTDLYATPYTNLGVNLMSGPEILAQSIDTIARHSWHTRLNQPQRCAYILLSALLGAAGWCLWKAAFYSGRSRVRKNDISRPALDLICCFSMVSTSLLIACLLFGYAFLIVPMIIPVISIVVASLATALWQQEHERMLWLQQRLALAEEKLKMQDEMHEAELKRKSAEARAQEVVQDEQRRKEFVRKINHDLKAPVTVMSWILSKLMKGGLSAEAMNEKIDKLAKTSNRLVDLLHELARDYETAQKADELAEQPYPCQLNQILQDCISMAMPLAEMKVDKLSLTQPDRILWVTSTPLQLSRVFDNLIRNAIVHNPSGTTIHVEARSRAHAHQIIVADTGAGMSSEQLRKVLDDASSGESSRRTDGTGMGLRIVKSFVEDMGGKLAVDSEPGIGTTFTITVPSCHLEAGGESGDDIYSTNEFKVVQVGGAVTHTSAKER